MGALTPNDIGVAVSGALLVPAMIALIVIAVRHRSAVDRELWSPLTDPERDWWGREEER